MTVLIVYVNDILITGDDTNEIQNLMAHSKEGIFISQHKYTVDLLQKIGQLTCKPTVTPVDIHVNLEQGGDSPPRNHLQAAYRILVYLKNIVGQGLLFSRGGDNTVEIYTDIDYAGSVSDRRSTSGSCSFVGGNLVSWRSKKQKVRSRSSRAEFRAMAQGTCEAIWIKILFEDLHLYSQGCIKLYYDNQSAIAIAII
ncbi:unnamed protein product [Spirodela intermedia]|uniref:Mitochondrial protein n=1 Tax=Spirodela intermedia TaxID=51605 RepID=A0ABN7ECL1_SPIIN|nr:unnamed protein product [Spirodela intermedia]